MRTVDPVKHGEKRRVILDAAERCFARDGFRGASISSICAEAGISPGHLYHYFESKEAILGAITRMVLEQATEQFGRTMESSDALAGLIADAQQAKARKQHGGHVLVLDMLAEAARNPALAEVLQEHSRGMRQLLAGFLRRGQARGRIDPSLDAETAASILIGVIDGSKIMAVRDPSLNRMKTIKLLHTLIVRFLTPPDLPEGPIVDTS
jgi:TetR/AcrR family transcriptional repressor of uid operon